jgi:DNA-binding transcriptional ArsR family regulator
MSCEPDPAPDLVFSALAHPARRRMLDLLCLAPGMGVKAVASHFEFSRIATMKHLAVLEGAGLVLSEKDGRVRKLFFNPVPIQQIYDRWTTQYSAFWAGHMVDIRARLEARAEQEQNKHA